jgi:acetate kinase
MKILVLNAGSSSQKSCLYEISEAELPLKPPVPVWMAELDRSQQADRVICTITTAQGRRQEIWDSDRAEAQRKELGLNDRHTQRMIETLWQGDDAVISEPGAIDVVGHRVVHGGDRAQACWVNNEVKAEIRRLSEFAPLHNPINLGGIELAEQLLPGIPQVAVFDTAFHRTLPPGAFTYPGPYHWLDQGIRRYGFHGISHHYCAQRGAQLLDRSLDTLNLITAHLGNGCSLAAIAAGQSVDTTMGFTPLDGLMMGSRSGSVDPGILLHLLRQGCSVEDLDQQLNCDSGLLGLSGISGDMRSILAAVSEGDQRGILALDVYVHRLRSLVGSMWMSLGRVDAIIFTAGVGENAGLVRSRVCEGLGWLGITIDEAKNRSIQGDDDIATAESKVRVLVIHTQEDWAIAQDCWTLLKANRFG